MRPISLTPALAVVLALAGFSAAPGAACAVVYQVTWTGSAGYTLDGTMSFDDSLLGAGVIDESSVDSLAFTGFQNGAPIGSWDWIVDGLSAGANFNFNFNTVSETFVTGGHAASPGGQQWNTSLCSVTNDFGFFSGNATQGFCLADGTSIGMIAVANSTLLATRIVIEIGAPSTLGLFGLGLLGLALAHRQRRSAPH